ncbi:MULTISPECIES: Crp/Fnr family transcriptional regulator [Listeria]|uniref:Crp/Fnr family transcriptional regulator n=1 Tax=Listeria TaxID=1637 RepID=UPI000B597989|nr:MULTISPECIES: Crp/Fnr family transcriptional regulator [Listeria]
MKNKETVKVIKDLEKNQAEPTWVRRMDLIKSTMISGKYFKEEFMIVIDGTMHLESRNKQIILFFSDGDVINQQVSELSIHNDLQLVCDTDVKVVFVYREYFLNFATNKPTYLKWFLDISLLNNMNLYNELIKYQYSSEERLMCSLKMICEKLNIKIEKGYYQIPSFINKITLSKYSHISRQQLDILLAALIKKREIKMDNRTLYIRN